MPENRNVDLPYLANRPKNRKRRLRGLCRTRQPRDRPHRAQPRPALEAGGGGRRGRLLPFHIHRNFKAFLGATLNQFVKRQRLERALTLMSHAPKRSLTDVALDCGFGSSCDFSRSFKQRYGAAPRAFDLETFRNSRREEFERFWSSQN